MRRGAIPIPLLALAALAPAPARADDTNYQNYLLGERALGLGGAFCALADDASGAFYNPAGAAWVPSSSASLSLNVYGIERRKVDRVYTAVLDGEPVSLRADDRRVATLPTTAGFVRKFGPDFDGVQRGAAGLATYLPYSSEFSAEGVLAASGGERASYTLTQTDKTLWIGPFAAWRVAPSLSLGLAVFYADRSVRRSRSTRISQAPGGLSRNVESRDEVVSYASGDLFARAGVRWDPARRLHVGLSGSTPAFWHLRGSGTVIDERLRADLDLDEAVYDPREDRGLRSRNPHPIDVRLGLAYGRDRHYLAAADATVHLPVRFHPLDLRNEPGAASPEALLPEQVERRRVVNGNIGTEYYVAGIVPIRAGIFTNLSSAPEVVRSDVNQLPHVDMYGATASIGYSSGDYDVSLGALYSVGEGRYAAWDGAAGAYLPARARHEFLYFYITGARKALTKAAKKVVGSVE